MRALNFLSIYRKVLDIQAWHQDVMGGLGLLDCVLNLIQIVIVIGDFPDFFELEMKNRFGLGLPL